jgi:hypothetical protein
MYISVWVISTPLPHFLIGCWLGTTSSWRLIILTTRLPLSSIQNIMFFFLNRSWNNLFHPRIYFNSLKQSSDYVRPTQNNLPLHKLKGTLITLEKYLLPKNVTIRGIMTYYIQSLTYSRGGDCRGDTSRDRNLGEHVRVLHTTLILAFILITNCLLSESNLKLLWF